MYKYNEDVIIKEISTYIQNTYKQHDSSDNHDIMAIEGIEASGNGPEFCLGNIIKYAWRFGKKDGNNEKDILKIIHYSILLLAMIRRNNQHEQK